MEGAMTNESPIEMSSLTPSARDQQKKQQKQQQHNGSNSPSNPMASNSGGGGSSGNSAQGFPVVEEGPLQQEQGGGGGGGGVRPLLSVPTPATSGDGRNPRVPSPSGEEQERDYQQQHGGGGDGTGSANNRQQSYQLNNGSNTSTLASNNNTSTNTAAAAAAAAPPHTAATGAGEILLRLRDVSKQFIIAGSTEIVTALRAITLDGANMPSPPPQQQQQQSQQSSGVNGFTTSGPIRVEDPNAMHFPAVQKGEFLMIRGPSGGGKTTLLNIIGTIDAPSTGTVELMGKKIDANSSDDELSDLRLKHIGFVFQTFNLIATMSAAENVELPMTLLGELDEKEIRKRAKQLLALVGLRNRAYHLPSELSGGEQQRVTIARALANNPDLLLLDEPTGDLDTQTTIEVMDLLLKINRMAGTTCIMVTHNPDVECYADRILYVSDGTFMKQVINLEPVPLVYEEYQQYLNTLDAKTTLGGATVGGGGGGTTTTTTTTASSSSSTLLPGKQAGGGGYNPVGKDDNGGGGSRSEMVPSPGGGGR